MPKCCVIIKKITFSLIDIEDCCIIIKIIIFEECFMIKIANEKPNIFEYIENVYCLDNFSAFAVTIKEIKFPTAEHAFQFFKFNEIAPEIAKQIMEANSPFEARKIAIENKPLRRDDWGKIKYKVMQEVLFQKTLQNPYVKEKLMSTCGKEIVEDCGDDDDKDWGCGMDGKGENNLGKIWMKIRECLDNENL